MREPVLAVACQMSPDERHYHLLKLLQERPGLSQRELASHLGISLGSTHYALKALLERGWVKAHNFRRSDNKKAYLYKLTPSGVTEKTQLAIRFLRHKRAEYDALWQEIEDLRHEIETAEAGPPFKTMDFPKTRNK